MELGPGKVIVVEADIELRDRLGQILKAAGYEVRASSTSTLNSVLEFTPDVMVLGADPPQLDCCDLLADVKGSEQARHTRVIMLAKGGSAERVRGLELGADDVLSLPFEDRELLARVRAQMREKRPEDELRQLLHSEKRSDRQARRLFHVVSKGRRSLRLALIAFAAFAVLLAVIGTVFYLRSQKQSASVYAALAKLQTSRVSEDDLINIARKAKTEAEVNANSRKESQQQALKRENQELHDKMAAADPSQLADLKKQLEESNARLQKLESESTVAEEIIHSDSSSVCLLHVAVGFRDKASGLPLRYTTLTPPSSQAAASGEVTVQLGGIGAEVRMDAFGTGFLVSPEGSMVTNHHVVEPWWKNDEISELLKQTPGVEATVVEMTAYFPGVPRGIAVKVQKVSSEADVAVVKGDVAGLRMRVLMMDDGPKAAISGEPVVLIGYPTGIDAILARSSEDTLHSIAAKTNGDVESLMTEVAARKLIRPVNTQGHVGDVLQDKIIYDAQTTSGGSGGPLFNSAGKVIGINVAVLRDFGGSNFAVPVHYAKSLLKE